MTGKKVRVAVIGTGWGARVHIPSFLKLPGAEVVAICTAHQDTAQEAAKRYGVPKAYWDYRQMVLDEEIDLVSVAARVSLHLPILLAALKAKKHVLCEWPLALNMRQAEELNREVKEAGVVHGVGNQGRFVPAIAHMRDLIQQGFVGEPLTFKMTTFHPAYTQPMPSQRLWLTQNGGGGTVLSIQGGHGIDILCWCLGEVQSLAAQVDTQIKETTFSDTDDTIEVTAPDSASILINMKNGATGSVNISRVAHHGSGFRFEVYGTEGSLIASSPAQFQYTKVTLIGGKKGQELHEIQPPKEALGFKGVGTEDVNFTFARLAERMVRAIKNRHSMSPNFVDALYLHRILDAASTSSARKGWVRP